MKEKWKEFVESIRKDKKKGLIVFVVIFGLIGTILMGVLLGNGKTDDKEAVSQVSSLDVPVDTTSFDQERGTGSVSDNSNDDDFFGSSPKVSEEEVKNESVSNSQGSSNNTYYKPKNYYSGGSSNKSNVVQSQEPITEVKKTEERKRTRVPSDGAGNMSGASGKLYKGSVANGNQLVKAGSYVKIRLAEDMVVNGMKIPKNTVVSGIAKVEGERMSIVITSVKIGAETRNVEWVVYDEDGNEGVAIPSNILNDIAKDGTKETISKGNKIEANVPIVGSVKVNLQKKTQEVSFVIRDGHRIYLKEKK